jgi:MFS family permease
MYQIDASVLRLPHGRTGERVRAGVSRTVLALGWTSLLTDISSEMVSTVLPVYFVLHLGITPLQFGFVDGIYQGVTALVRLAGGRAGDRWRRHKEIALAGYGVSAISKIGLVLAGGVWPALLGLIAVDRMGKGVRTAPRDALISLTTEPARLGRAFGVHRAFDSLGAMLGPLTALAILASAPDRFDLIFVTSFGIAAIGVGVLLLFVQNVSSAAEAAFASTSGWLRGAHARRLAAMTTAAALLGLATTSDAFIYLLLQREAGFNAALFPLLYVGTSASYLVLAIPAGRLADRVGRRITFLAGHVPLLLAYWFAAQSHAGVPILIGCLLLLGTYYAMTDGVLMALAGAICPVAHRASGMALVTTVTSAARFVAPVAFGALWTRYDAATAVQVFAGALAVALPVAAVILRQESRWHTDAVNG